MLQKKTRPNYKWVILVVCFLMEFICLGFCSSNNGLYTKAVTEALEIKRSVYSLSTSIRYAVQVITALFFGFFIKKLGVKKMACGGLLALTASVVVRAVATEFYHLYIGGALWGMGIVFCGGTMASTIIRRWFHKDVGTITGIVMSANGVGGAVAAQVITPIINGSPTGYQMAYWLSGIISFAITVLVVIFLREQPAEENPSQTAGGKKQPKGDTWTGLEFKDILKKPYFYATAALILITGISLQSIGNINIVYMGDVGLPTGFIATVATVSSLCLSFSKILVGRTYDKKGLGFTLRMCQLASVVAFVLSALITKSTTGMVLAMTATVLATVAQPLETVALPLLSGDLFGSVAYTRVLGVFMAMNSLGLCLGSPLADLYFDIAGTYKPCFWFFAAIMAHVAMAYIFVIRAARKDREKILAQHQQQ